MSQINFLITGANNGIGFEVVKILAQNPNNNVFAISRSIDKLENLAFQSASTNIFPIKFDLLKDQISSLFEIIPNINVLVNNAGLLYNNPFNTIPENQIREIFEVNYFKPLELIRSLLPIFNPIPYAHIINIGSMGGFQGSEKFPGLSIYSSSKAAISCLTECLAQELAQFNIKINCLCLGSVQTNMLETAFPGYKAQANPFEIAQFIVDFATERHKLFNGKNIPVALTTP